MIFVYDEIHQEDAGNGWSHYWIIHNDRCTSWYKKPVEKWKTSLELSRE